MGRVGFGTVLTKKEVIERTDSFVNITYVLRECGIYAPDDIPDGTSLKTHCPFDHLHSDQGQQPALRVWSDSNSAMCFAENLYLTPVRLWSLYRDTSQYTAALELLDKTEMDVTNLSLTEPPEISHLRSLEQALATYCTRLAPDWNLAPLKYPQAHHVFVTCLQATRYVSTDEDIEKWLVRCKAAMTSALQDVTQVT